MTNTLNTPIEALERTFPVRIERYAVRQMPRRRGEQPGGAGVIRRYRFLVPAEVSLVTERRRQPAPGLNGASDGMRGDNRLIRADGTVQMLRGKVQVKVAAGDAIEVRTPGGGSWRDVSPSRRGP